MRISTTQVSLNSDAQVEKVGNSKKKELWYKSRKKQVLCHEIEPNPSKDRAMHEGDNPSF
jgi:hypothetical protein